MKKLLAVVCMLSLLSPIAFAKASDSSDPEWAGSRYGIGINAQVNGIDTASIRYWQNREWGLEGILGYNSFSNSTNASIIGGKYFRPVWKEKNLTLYGFGMVEFLNQSSQTTTTTFSMTTGMLTTTTTTASASGTILAVGVGVEFFLNEIPNLGFGAEMGLADQTGDVFDASNTKGITIYSNVVNSINLHYYFK